MKSRYFWEKSTFRKFTIIFEADLFIQGRDLNNQLKLFRKDTGLISFSEREILEIRLTELKTDQERESEEKKRISTYQEFGFQACFN